jgi:hypothetical protein
VTGSLLAVLMRLPEPSGRQSGDLGKKWPLQFCLRTLLVLFMPEGSFTCRKSTTWDRRLYFPSLKIHGPRSGSNPRTLGPVASTLTTSPPRATIIEITAIINNGAAFIMQCNLAQRHGRYSITSVVYIYIP